MGETIELKLPAALEGAAADALIGELLSLRGMPLTLDAAGLERLGGLGLQLLLSTKRTWAADRQTLSIVNLPATLQETLALSGAQSLLA